MALGMVRGSSMQEMKWLWIAAGNNIAITQKPVKVFSPEGTLGTAGWVGFRWAMVLLAAWPSTD